MKRERSSSSEKKTIANACKAFGFPEETYRWYDFYHKLLTSPFPVKMMHFAVSFIPRNELIFFLKKAKSILKPSLFDQFISETEISFHRSKKIHRYEYEYDLQLALIRLNYPLRFLPSMGYLWLNWSPQTHLNLPKLLCKQVFWLLMVIRHLPKDLRIRICRTFVILDYPIDNIGKVTDVSIEQSEDQRIRFAWSRNNWSYFGKFYHKTDVIRYFFEQGILEKMYHFLNMSFEDFEMGFFSRVNPDLFMKIHSVAFKLGYIGEFIASQWFSWTTERHLIDYNIIFCREVKFILHLRPLRQVRFIIIRFLACLYGIENQRGSQYLCNLTKNQLLARLEEMNIKISKSKSFSEIHRICVRENNFRELLIKL